MIVKDKGGPIDALLASVPLFAQLDRQALSRLTKSAVQIAAPRGTILFRPGDPCSGVHAVISGRVKLALPAQGHAEKVIALVGAGHTLGESAMFLHEAHFLSAETLSDTILVHVPESSVFACMKRNPEFACHMASALSRRQRELIGELESSTLHSGTQRVIKFILGELAPGTDDGAAAITLPAKKRIIASRLDLTHEYFSRILHELAAVRLIVVEGPKVTIPDVDRLRAYRE